jgi:hypothetical protein
MRAGRKKNVRSRRAGRSIGKTEARGHRGLRDDAIYSGPAWSDACDPKQQVVTEFDDGMGRSSSGPTPAWWPCDADGNFIPTPHFTAAQ